MWRTGDSCESLVSFQAIQPAATSPYYGPSSTRFCFCSEEEVVEMRCSLRDAQPPKRSASCACLFLIPSSRLCLQIHAVAWLRATLMDIWNSMLTGVKGGKQDRLMCACHNVIPIESAGTCKHHIRLDFLFSFSSKFSFLFSTQRRRSHFFSPRPHPYLPCFAPLSRIERLSLHCSPN